MTSTFQTCVLGFNPGRHQPWTGSGSPELQRLTGMVLGGCFCRHCRTAAEKRGIDWQAMVSRLQWLADGYEHDKHKQAFDMNLLWHSSMTATALSVTGAQPPGQVLRHGGTRRQAVRGDHWHASPPQPT